MPRTAPLALLLLALAAAPAIAQDTRTPAPAAEVPALVTFTIGAELEPGSGGPANVPFGILDLVSREAAVTKFQTNHAGVELQLTFRSMQAFRAWYTSAAGKELMKAVADAARAAPYTSLAVFRDPREAAAGRMD